MSYDLQFLPSALKEWQKLGSTIREQFKKKLAERLETPRVQGDVLHGLEHHYKIKLTSAPTLGKGFHLGCEDLGPTRRIVVHGGDQSFPLAPRCAGRMLPG